MRRIVTAAVASFTLAACGGGTADADGDGEISMEEAAAQTADMVRPLPGQYRATVEFVDVELPGAPQPVQDALPTPEAEQVPATVEPEPKLESAPDAGDEGDEPTGETPALTEPGEGP